jgi:hypothetical protein
MSIRIHKEHLKQELLKPSVIIGGSVLAAVYILFSTLIINYKLITETVSGSYSFSHKITLILSLFLGITSLFPLFELLIILFMGFLMGVNVVLLVTSLRERKKQKGDWTFGLGFAGMLATTGCAGCGITLLSFLGPTVSLSMLPFQGIVLQGTSMLLLIVSLIHTLNRRVKNCVITTR